jgi:hypothetical protein
MKHAQRVVLLAAPWLISLSAAFAIATSSVEAAPPSVTLALGAVGQEGHGTIKGRLVWGGDAVPTEAASQPAGKAENDPALCDKDARHPKHDLEIDPKTKGIRYAIAYLVRPKGANPEALKALLANHPKVVMDQKNCDFIPASIAITKNQKVVFKSSDNTPHNVNVNSLKNVGFNESVAPHTQIEKSFIADNRPIKVDCNIHNWMHGHIMVFDHPFFAVTDKDGSFEIKGVPAGTQNVVIWQEKAGFDILPGLGRGKPVEVMANGVVDLGDIKLGPAQLKK